MLRRSISYSLILLIILALIPRPLVAEDHVVSPAELQQAVQTSSDHRAQNLAQINRLLSSRVAEDVLSKASVDPERVQRAVVSLSDEELEQLASKAGKLNQDFSAGVLTNRELTYVVIGLAFVILLVAASS